MEDILGFIRAKASQRLSTSAARQAGGDGALHDADLLQRWFPLESQAVHGTDIETAGHRRATDNTVLPGYAVDDPFGRAAFVAVHIATLAALRSGTSESVIKKRLKGKTDQPIAVEEPSGVSEILDANPDLHETTPEAIATTEIMVIEHLSGEVPGSPRPWTREGQFKSVARKKKFFELAQKTLKIVENSSIPTNAVFKIVPSGQYLDPLPSE